MPAASRSRYMRLLRSIQILIFPLPSHTKLIHSKFQNGCLSIAAASSTIQITSFTPTTDILTLPQLYYLENNKYISVTNRKCKKRKCDEFLQFYRSDRNKADGYTARCNKHKRQQPSIKEGSFFAQHKMAISKQIYIPAINNSAANKRCWIVNHKNNQLFSI